METSGLVPTRRNNCPGTPPASIWRMRSLGTGSSLLIGLLAVLFLAACDSQKSSEAADQSGGSGGPVWARFVIENSNGVTKRVTCPGTQGCNRLRKSLDGRLFVYSPRYEEDPEVNSGSIDLTDPPYKPKRLPGFNRNRMGPPKLGKWPAADGVPCFLEKTGDETIRVRGTIRGREFDFRRGQENSCESQEYGLWNLLFETDSTQGIRPPETPEAGRK